MYDSIDLYLKNMMFEIKVASGIKMKIFIFLFRISSYAYYRNRLSKIFLLPFIIFYKFYSEFLVCADLPAKVQAGSNLRIYHGFGLVVHPSTIFGSGCILRHGVTIGNKMDKMGRPTLPPVIGNNVEFGVGSVVIGEIKIGDNVVIGACTVVTKNIPDNSIVVGMNMRMLS